MEIDYSAFRKQLIKDYMEAMIRLGLIAFLLFLCMRTFAPFAELMVWALILAIALYPLHQILARRFNERQGLSATVLVLAGLLLIGGPMMILGGSLTSYGYDLYTAFENDTITIKQPDPKVADLPLIGKQIYATWNSAAEDLPDSLEKNQAKIKSLAKFVFSGAKNALGTVLLFMSSLIIAGIMMAHGEPGSRAMQRIFIRLTDPGRGQKLQTLSTATVRSVAVGVVGVAFIQALLLGVGFIMVGIPAAGLLAVVVMLIGIVQLPALIISLPVIAYLWWSGDGSTASNIAYTIYLFGASMTDNVLKPLLLGRGVAVPMPVILLGALGGMMASGMIGLFIGAVLLTVGYNLFMEWVNASKEDNSAGAAPTQSEAAAQTFTTSEEV